MADHDHQVMTIAEVAAAFGVTVSTVHLWIKQGKLPEPKKYNGLPFKRFVADDVMRHARLHKLRIRTPV